MPETVPPDPRVPGLSWLLRSWRMTTVFESNEVAARVLKPDGSGPISPATLRSWERPSDPGRRDELHDSLGHGDSNESPDREAANASRRRVKAGDRTADSYYLDRLDEIYGARGALAGMARSLGTPGALPAQSLWWHNYPREGQPVWAWIRPEHAGEVRVEGEWGVAVFKVSRLCSPWGVILTCPYCTHNPPVRISFLDGGRGWVDFGVGEVPSRLGRERPRRVGRRPKALSPTELLVINAVMLIRPRSVTRLYHLNGGSQSKVLREWLRQANAAGALDYLQTIEDYSPVPFPGYTDHADPKANPTFPPAERHIHFSGDDWRRLREARRLSARDVVNALARIDGRVMRDLELGADPDDLGTTWIRRNVEAGKPAPVSYIEAALDTIYDAGGITFRDLVPCQREASRSDYKPTLLHSSLPLPVTFTVKFPDFWVGPVWFQFIYSRAAMSAPVGASAFVEMEWGPWGRALKASSGTTVWTRRSRVSVDPLVVHLPSGWELRAGMGRYTPIGSDLDAIDINGDWVARSSEGRDAIFRQMIPVYEYLRRREPKRFGRLLVGLRRLPIGRHPSVDSSHGSAEEM